jgi:hypothetical protein
MKYYFTYLFIIIANHFFAQVNLVPNPSFEDTTYCPTGNVNKATGWFSPSLGTPDIFRDSGNVGVCWESCEWIGVANYSNGGGYQLPRTGRTYAGFKTLGSMPGATREYISIQLSDTLEAGKKYCVSFYTSLGNYSGYAFDKIGAAFSSLPYLDCSNSDAIISNNGIANEVGDIILDTLSWVQVSDTFVAAGGELYITLGNFFDDTNLQIVTTGFGAQMAYHYFDDVEVMYCDSVIDPPHTYPDISLTPTIGSGEISLSGNFPEGTQLEVYDMVGQRVYYNELQSGNQSQTLYLTLADGAYIYRIQAAGTTLKTGKLVFTR